MIQFGFRARFSITEISEGRLNISVHLPYTQEVLVHKYHYKKPSFASWCCGWVNNYSLFRSHRRKAARQQNKPKREERKGKREEKQKYAVPKFKMPSYRSNE